MKFVVFTGLLMVAMSSNGLEPYARVTYDEMYSSASNVVIIHMRSGEYFPDVTMGVPYKICGDVILSLKGDVAGKVCFEDFDAYDEPCFKRTFGDHYMAFLTKKRGELYRLKARGAVFKVGGFKRQIGAFYAKDEEIEHHLKDDNISSYVLDKDQFWFTSKYACSDFNRIEGCRLSTPGDYCQNQTPWNEYIPGLFEFTFNKALQRANR